MRFFRRLRILISDVYLMVVTYLPGTSGQRLRFGYWKKRLRHLGTGVRIDPGVLFQNPGYISIGDWSWIDRDVSILAGRDSSLRERTVIENPDYPEKPGTVYVGKSVHIAIGCLLSGIEGGIYISDECNIAAHSALYAFSHRPKSPSRPSDSQIVFGPRVDESRQSLLVGSLYLGRNTGVALGVTILPGVSIGENSFVTIASVVSRGQFPENSLIGGDPAKKIGLRFQPHAARNNV